MSNIKSISKNNFAISRYLLQLSDRIASVATAIYYLQVMYMKNKCKDITYSYKALEIDLYITEIYHYIIPPELVLHS